MADEYDIEELVTIYNQGRTTPQNHWLIPLARPTATSLQTVNERFTFELPESFIYFSQHCMSNDLCLSIGEDYDSPFHIFSVNGRLRKLRRRTIGARGKWEYVFPRNFVALTTWCDDDWNCFDLNTQDERSGEYEVVHWATPRYLGKTQASFPNFLASTLKFWKMM